MLSSFGEEPGAPGGSTVPGSGDREKAVQQDGPGDPQHTGKQELQGTVLGPVQGGWVAP